MEALINSFRIGTPVMLLGLGTVFAVLMLLWGVLELFRVFFYEIPRKKEAAKAGAAAAQAIQPQEYTGDQEELIAISSAVISTMIGMPANNLRIKSIRRV